MNFLCVLTKINKFPFELEISKRSCFVKKFVVGRKNVPNHYPEQKIKLCSVIGGKFKISAQDTDVAHFF